MPSLNFKLRFAPFIENGEKRQTIRKMRKSPFKTGDALYLFTGMRTASCRRLGTYRCISAENIQISDISIELNGRILSTLEVQQLAHDDGFQDSNEFIAFFSREHDLPLYGQLIRW